MHVRKTTLLLILFTLTVTMMTATAMLRVESQNLTPTNKQKDEERYRQRLEFESQFPVVEYEAPDPTDPKKLAKRKNKSKRYDKSNFAIKDPSPNIGETSVSDDWEFYVAAIPAGQSDVVVVGEVLSAEAHLSLDKSGIYSEFIIRVDEVLKQDASNQLAQADSISVERIGGIVRYPSGHKRLIRINGQNMPRVSRRYVLFLKTLVPGQDYSIVTGYEFRLGKVFPLDNSMQMDAYKGMDEATFMKKIREAITQPPQTAPQ